MPLDFNNSNDIFCNTLYLLDSSNTQQNVLDIIANTVGGGGGSSGITELIGGGIAVVTGSATSKTVTIDLNSYPTNTYINNLISDYSTTTSINTLLSDYVTTSAINALSSDYRNTTALTSLLNDRVDNSRILSDVPAGAIYSDTIYSKRSNKVHYRATNCY